MNLLKDSWIPVQRDNVAQQITFKELLCRDEPWQMSLPRDDLEMACLQLLIALVQTLFTPKDRNEWFERHDAPLSECEYDAQAERYSNWFDLDHATQPFMQTRGVEARKITPIQKLFVGLPEGDTSHAFFNLAGEVSVACGSCCAIALFNQASNAPSFGGGPGGGFKPGLRRSTPVTTIVFASRVRQIIWRNVLRQDVVDHFYPDKKTFSPNDSPVWVQPIARNTKVPVSNIGLLRGLFWQPARVELMGQSMEATCECCGANANNIYSGFRKATFGFEVDGTWLHPSSPRQLDVRNNRFSYLSFSKESPAWTQLSQYLFPLGGIGNKPGYSPALAVDQYSKLADRLDDRSITLLVGGYVNERGKTAKIAQRRHELFNLAAGWIDHADDISRIVSLGLQVKNALNAALAKLIEKVKDPNTKAKESTFSEGIRKASITRFYCQSEPLIHTQLGEMDFHEFKHAHDALAEDLSAIALEIFEQQTAPYRHRPEIYRIIALARGGLRAKLNMLTKGDRNAADGTS
jgi:CRISPR system Cascade subunit CasA